MKWQREHLCLSLHDCIIAWKTAIQSATAWYHFVEAIFKTKLLARTKLLVVLVQGISSSPFATQDLSVSVYIRTIQSWRLLGSELLAGGCTRSLARNVLNTAKDIKMGSWHLSVGSVNSFPFISIKNLNIAKKCFTHYYDLFVCRSNLSMISSTFTVLTTCLFIPERNQIQQVIRA